MWMPPLIRTLLIEESVSDARVIQSVLSGSAELKFEVVHVTRLQEGIESLRHESFSIVLLDLILPDSQGLEGLEQLLNVTQVLPIIVLTGQSDKSLAVSALQLGAQEYLVKDDTPPAALINSIRYAIARKRNDLKLFNAEQRLSLAVAADQVGIFERNIQTGIVSGTPQVAKLLGWESNPLEIAFDDVLEHVHPSDRQSILDADQTALRRHDTEMVRSEPFRVTWSDGTVHWVEARRRVARNDEGAPVRMLGTLTEVTERRNAEAAIRVKESELAHAARFNIMGQMAVGLAHELRQPLGAILTYASACLLQMHSPAPDHQIMETAVTEVMNETRRAEAIISSLRSFVCKQPPKYQLVDLNGIIHESLNLLRFEIRQTSVNLAISLAADLPRVNADPIQLSQIIVNLVYNALDAIQASNDPRKELRIETSCDLDQKRVHVAVIDSGIGISPENLGKLFNAFFTTKPQGMGMGLNISQSIIENLGGGMSAENNPGGGSRLSFTLPVKASRCANPVDD